MRKCTYIERKTLLKILDVRALPTDTQNVEIYIDNENFTEILEIFENFENFTKKIRRIIYEMLLGRYNNDLYGKENINQKSENLTAMKIKSKENIRIYCKEFFDENNLKKIVIIKPFIKKTQKIDKKLKSILNQIADYEYDFEK